MESDKIANYIKIARTIEKQLGCKIYIVGGYVRDKIIGASMGEFIPTTFSGGGIIRPSTVDLDFVVEGDGLQIAKLFCEKLGGKLTIYKKFLTASIKLDNGFVIDIATARTETYPFPASMPVVQPAKIEKDLLRRDFTINTLAIPLATRYSPLANTIDVSGGLDDLKNKLIRVLHKKSFTDDPTRILRALRYAIRFNFKIEENTEKWMNAAIKKNLLSLVSASRIRDEFIKTLEEKNVKKILTEFKKRKILKYIDNKLNISALSEKQQSASTHLKKLLKNFTEEEKISFLKKLCLPH